MKKLLAIHCVLLALLTMQSPGQANNTQILTDSSLSGIGGVEIDATGSGQIYTLSELNGKLASDNLFYSFSQFNIGSGDTVWFNLNTPDLAQVISRVTAGNPSYFDGQLKMTNAAVGAAPHFFFINPAGITFEPGASVDVPGSFYVTTASTLNFSDGSQWAVDSSGSSFLSSATPESFGFLGNEIGALNFTGTASDKTELDFKSGTQVAFVANAIQLEQTVLKNIDTTQAGLNLQLITTGNTTAAVGINALPNLATSGQLTLQDSIINASGNGSGQIAVRSDNLWAKNSILFVDVTGNQSMSRPSGIDIAVNSQLTIDNTTINHDPLSLGSAGKINVVADTLTITNGADIHSITVGQGNAADVSITANKIEINDAESTKFTGIISSAEKGSKSSGGDIMITGESLNLMNKGLILAATSESQDGGDILLNVNELTINDASIGTFTSGGAQAAGGDIAINTQSLKLSNGSISAFSSNQSQGNSGNIAISADLIDIRDKSSISTATQGEGHSGSVTVSANTTQLSTSSFINSSAFGTAKGNSGAVTVRSQNIYINDSSAIASDTASSGNGGDVTVIADFLQFIDGGLIDASTFAKGNAGNISIETNKLVSQNGIISTRVITNQEFGTQGEGDAGNIKIKANSIYLSNDTQFDRGIFSGASLNTTGNAGSISIEAPQIELNGAFISASTASKGNAGEITINSDELLLSNRASISSSTDIKESTGQGGVVTINSQQVKLENSSIKASTSSAGNAGNVLINAGSISLGKDGMIDLSAFEDSAGNAGTVILNANALVIEDGMVTSFTVSKGNAGDVAINVKELIMNDGFVSSSTTSEGNAGNVHIVADNVLLANTAGISTSATSLEDNLQSKGDAGTVSIDAKHLELSSGAFINSATLGEGNAGKIEIKVNNLIMNSDAVIATNSGSSKSKIFDAKGNAGSIVIDTNQLQLSQSIINSDTFGPGNSGDISINAGTMQLFADGLISSSTFGSGQAGNITVQADSLSAYGNGTISSDLTSRELTGIFTSAGLESSGHTGKIGVNVKNDLRLSNGAQISTINLSATADPLTPAGDIHINLADSTLFLDFATISTEAVSGQGGAITVDGADAVFLRNAPITTSVTAQGGNGGDITVTANALIMDSGFIQANTEGAGASGGNVKVAAANIIPSGGNLLIGGNTPLQSQPASGLNVIQAAAPNGLSGTINASSPQLNLSGMLMSLALDTFDNNTLNRNVCTVDENSTLLQMGKGAPHHRIRDFLLPSQL